MPRTTSDQVEGIIKVRSSDDLTPFIEAANAMVTDQCTASGYDDVRLELIERWLAAHFYAVFKPRRLSEQAGSVQGTIESKVDLGFKVTRYGQQAMRLDSAGNLAALDNTLNTVKKTLGGRTGVTWLGTEFE